MPGYTGPVWYMSTNGSDSYDGSVNTPFSTLAYAVGKANSGDTVSIAAGTYYGINSVFDGPGQGNRFVDPNGKQLVIMGIDNNIRCLRRLILNGPEQPPMFAGKLGKRGLHSLHRGDAKHQRRY